MERLAFTHTGSRMKTKITQNELKEILEYNEETGRFTWRSNRSANARAGEVAGTKRPDGYLVVNLGKVQYFNHRLVWLYVHGDWPRYRIDHINGNREDNRINNLRDVPPRDNSLNQKSHREGKLKGAYFNKRDRRWLAYIRINGEKKYLGSFTTGEEAQSVYLKTKERLDVGVVR